MPAQPVPAPVKVAVTELEYHKAEAVFRDAAGLDCIPVPIPEAGLAAAIRETGARHAIISAQPYRDELYRALKPGAVLARFGVGHDGVDKQKATAAGILCTNTPGVLDQSVAEHTMLLIGEAARHLTPMAASMRALQWAPIAGVELHGRTLAVIGAGPIGRAVARIAALGYGMRVVGVDVAPRPASDGFESIGASFEEAVRDADFVTLHIPATPENARFLDAARIARMRRNAWLINTARGAVVHENDLYDALASGRLAGAALDVFEREPYVPSDPARDLRSLPNAILTPHTGSNTAEANRRMAERALRNVALAEAGDLAALDLLNPAVLARR